MQHKPAMVVVATAKVRIFKQITTAMTTRFYDGELLLLPQRYEFSSKSQHLFVDIGGCSRCCCYRKGTNFQANHNSASNSPLSETCCCCYRKGTNFQANHNRKLNPPNVSAVVVATAKVRIFKQITTINL